MDETPKKNISAENNSIAAGRDINIISPTPSDFVLLVDKIIKTASSISPNMVLSKPPDIDEKIIYNNLNSKERSIKNIISGYAVNFSSIEQAKEILENDPASKGSFEQVISIINQLYVEIEEDDCGQSDAKRLWENMVNKLKEDNKIYDTNFNHAINQLFVYAFVKCKIFKEPK